MLSYHRLIIFLLAFLFYPVPLHSQLINYTQYTIKDGLPTNTITALLQDYKGYIWFGTNNGLCVYSGTEFKTYSTIDGLTNNWITEIAESKNDPGTLWIGTIAGGINKFKGGKFQTFTFGSDPDSNNISNLVIDKNGAPWFTTAFGLWTIRNNLIIKINLPNKENDQEVTLLSVDGDIWCSKGNQIFKYDNSLNSWAEIIKLKPDDKIVSMVADKGNKVWIGTESWKIFLIDSNEIIRSAKTKFGKPSRLILKPDDIIGRDNDKLFYISKSDPSIQNILAIPSNKEMPPDVTSPLLIDKEDNIWIGTWNKGLIKISDPSTYTIQFGESIRLHTSAIDNYGHIWVSTENGLYEVYRDENNNWAKYFHTFKQKYKSTKIFVNLIDSKNRLWLSSDYKDIFSYKLKNIINKPSKLIPEKIPEIFNDMNNEVLLTAYEDNQNRLWFSFAHKGLISLKVSDLDLINFFGEGYNLPGNEIRAVYQDASDRIWIGGWQEGISIYNPGKFEAPLKDFYDRITTVNGLPDNMIRAISEDQQGNIWIGTRHNGVIIFNNDSKISQRITMKEGLLSNSIWKILRGPENTFWLLTDSGIEQINATSLKVIPSRKEFLISGIYSLTNWKNKVWVSNDNEVLYIYEPSGSEKRLVSPPVDITKILVNGNLIDRKNLSNLSSDQNNITVEYTALSFKDEKAVRYQYRLLGAGESWTDPIEHHFVSFASLSPGEYKFEVRAINSEGIVSDNPASFSFVIMPPFWRQWWFILLIALLISGIIYLVFRSRIKRLLELEKLRLRIASDLHDDVGTNLSSILLSSQLMERKFVLGNSEKEYLGQLRSTASKTQELLREIVWLLNPSNDTPENLMLRLKSIAAEILQDIPYSFHSDENLFPEKLSIEFKRNIVLIFKESLQNIIKHSSASKVNIELKRDKNIGLIRISDNGKGFDEKKIEKGNGLVNICNRAEAIKGKLEINSIEGSGTTISLRFNITQTRTTKRDVIKIN